MIAGRCITRNALIVQKPNTIPHPRLNISVHARIPKHYSLVQNV